MYYKGKLQNYPTINKKKRVVIDDMKNSALRNGLESEKII